MVPMELQITIEKALKDVGELRALYEEDGEVKRLIDIASALEGMPRHASTHAAGVVITQEPLTKHLPLYKATEGPVTTQFAKETVEELGLLKMDQHKAHGSSLVALVFTGIAGMIIYNNYGSVDVLAAMILAASGIIMSRYGVKHALALPDWKLKRAFGGLLCSVALLLLLKTIALPLLAPPFVAKVIILLVGGALTGFISGMMGIGGGAIMVVIMVFFTGSNQFTAQGTSLLAMAPIGLVGAYTHWRFGTVNKDILPLLIPGIIIGSLTGGYFAHRLPELVLRLIFSAVLVWMGVKYLSTAKPSENQ